VRIGYFGFVNEQDVDLLVVPPSSVNYQPEVSPESKLTTKGLTELRRYTSPASYKIVLRWADISERELARLALIPPSEVVSLINERGRIQQVVIDEPVRSMKKGVSDMDGNMLYTASLNVYPVTKSAANQNVRLRQGSVLDSFKTSKAPRLIEYDPEQPTEPTPANYTAVKESAKSGLPPTMNIGEGIRFTFEELSVDYGRYEYFDVTMDGRIELSYNTSQDFFGWYSHVPIGGALNVTGTLKRYPFSVADDFTVTMLVWPDESLNDGNIIRTSEVGRLFTTSYRNGSFNVTWNNGGVVQNTSVAASPNSYHFLAIQGNNGNLSVELNGVSQSIASSNQTAPTFSTDTTEIGGGSVYIDDLILANSADINVGDIYSWLVRVP